MQLYQKVSGEIVRLPLSAITRPTQYELCEFYSFRNPALKPGFQPCQGGVIENAAIKTDTQRAAVTAYRTALRDLPAQDGAPWDGGEEQTPWPEMPGLR